jgi:peptide deformylase
LRFNLPEMILPIVTYGAAVLHETCSAVPEDYPGLQDLIADMCETMYAASGCGLAAPQINIPISLFIVDSAGTYNTLDEAERRELFDGDTGIKAAFINAEILATSTAMNWMDTEGCLSLPGLLAMVSRPWSITIRYRDHKFRERTQIFSGLTARMIQHEYDHTRGILYMDHLQPVARKAFLRKLKRKQEEGWKAGYPLKG